MSEKRPKRQAPTSAAALPEERGGAQMPRREGSQWGLPSRTRWIGVNGDERRGGAEEEEEEPAVVVVQERARPSGGVRSSGRRHEGARASER